MKTTAMMNVGILTAVRMGERYPVRLVKWNVTWTKSNSSIYESTGCEMERDVEGGLELAATIAEEEKGKLGWCEVRYDEEEKKKSEVVVKRCCELGDANHGTWTWELSCLPLNQLRCRLG
jgi:hypothetical protein